MTAPTAPAGRPRRIASRPLALVVLLVVLLLAGVASSYAASSPDGLTAVSQDQGFDTTATTHATEDGPFAGYAARFVAGDRLAGGLAGVVGVLVVLALGTGLTLVLRRRGAPGRAAADGPADAERT